MSEMARKAREANKAKAVRMTTADPHQKVDSSSWTPGEPMNANAQTGMRPVSKRQFRRGGKVHGEKAEQRADRKPRKAGGRVDDYVNRNVRSANAELGKPHIGGFKDGGGTNFRKRMHADVGEDKRLIKHMVKPSAIRSHKRNGGGQFVERSHKAGGGALDDVLKDQGSKASNFRSRMGDAAGAPAAPKTFMVDQPTGQGGDGAMKRGGRTHKARGGDIDSTGMRPTGDRIPHKRGGRAKGKTNIVISIGQPQQQPQMPPPQMMPKPPMGVPVPPPMPPQGMPPGGAPGMGLGAGGPQMPPGMPRKSGGRAEYPTVAKAKRVRSPKGMDAGSLSGLGRIEKSAMAERSYVRAK